MNILIIFISVPSNEITRENLQMQTQNGFDPAVKLETTMQCLAQNYLMY